jgi:hypothetical protein
VPLFDRFFEVGWSFAGAIGWVAWKIDCTTENAGLRLPFSSTRPF